MKEAREIDRIRGDVAVNQWLLQRIERSVIHRIHVALQSGYGAYRACRGGIQMDANVFERTLISRPIPGAAKNQRVDH